MTRRLTILLAALGGLLALSVVVYLFLIGGDDQATASFRNVSRAMEPTVLAGDMFTVRWFDKTPISELKRGLLIVHAWPPEPSKKFIKRLIGLPEDTLAMVDGVLQLNGRPLTEPYAWHEEPSVDPLLDDFAWQRQYLVGRAKSDTAHYVASRNNWGPLAVPANVYFVLGDNRDNSLDSRYWGFVPAGDLLGEVHRVYFSRDPTTGGVRWSRFGRRLR